MSVHIWVQSPHFALGRSKSKVLYFFCFSLYLFSDYFKYIYRLCEVFFLFVNYTFYYGVRFKTATGICCMRKSDEHIFDGCSMLNCPLSILVSWHLKFYSSAKHVLCDYIWFNRISTPTWWSFNFNDNIFIKEEPKTR